MDEVLRVVLSLSLSGALVILVLMALKPLLGRRVSQTWRYYIWAVAALRLLIPFTPEVSLVGYLTAPPAALVQMALPAADQASPGGEAPPTVSADWPVMEAETPAPTPLVPVAELPQLLGSVWFLIAALLLVRKLTGYRGYTRYLRADSRAVTNEEVLAVYRASAQALGVRRPPALLVSRMASSSMLLGMVRPAVVVTEGQLGAVQSLAYVFRHELIHYRRLDYWYKWLFQLAVCVHWFNPLVYVLCREVGRACERACDEAVASALDEPGRRAYGTVLLDALEYRGGYDPAGPFIPLCGSAKLMRERLDLIQMTGKKSKLASVLSLLLAAVLCCGAVYTGAYAVKPVEQVSGTVPAAVEWKAKAPKASGTLQTPVPAPVTPVANSAAPSIEGYRVLRDVTLPLDGITSISLDFGIEAVTVLPSQGNVLRFVDYGKTGMAFTQQELVQYDTQGGALTIKSGKWNEKWFNMSSDTWRQRVYVYLPAGYGGALAASVSSGSLDVTMALSVGAASVSSGSGTARLMDIKAVGLCELSTVSGTLTAGAVQGQRGGLSSGSGSIRAGAVTMAGDCTVSVVSGDLTVTGGVSGGACHINSGSGTIWAGDVAAVGDLALNLVSGDITLGNLSGMFCEIASGSGDFALKKVSAQKELSISTVSGQIELEDATCAAFSLDTGSGVIEMDALTGRGEASTVSGQIVLGKLHLTGDLDLVASSGSISAALDRGVGVKLTGSASSGGIDAFFPLHETYANRNSTGPYSVSGQYGSAPYRAITASVSSGTVDLK